MSETTRIGGNGNGKGDPRLDRLATWGLNFAVTVALLVAGHYARATGEKVDAVAAAQATLNVDVQVMKAEVTALRSISQDNAELRRDLAAMRVLVGALQSEVATMRRDIDRPR
jgi:outer membrane murein-binding lipoprotein Lpp